jgi:hypothetical protein
MCVEEKKKEMKLKGSFRYLYLVLQVDEVECQCPLRMGAERAFLAKIERGS